MARKGKHKITAGVVDAQLSARLNSLLEKGVLEHPDARSIAKHVACNGVSVLTPEERYLYTWHIVPYLRLGSASNSSELCEEAHLSGVAVPISRITRRERLGRQRRSSTEHE